VSQESNPTDGAEQKQPTRGWPIVGVGVGAVVLVAALFAVVWTLIPRPENRLGLSGSLKIETGPDVDVYIGNKHVGTGSLELTWDQLLGTPNLQPLARPVTSVFPSPSTEGMGAVTAEALGGEGSSILWKKNGWTSITPLPIACKQILLRRKNGVLDLISVIDGEFATQSASPRRFLVPIRLRSTKAELSEFVCGEVESWNFGANNQSIHGIVRSTPTPPPDEFAEEIAKKGLWIPQK
jgi:hypothetical protein